jgi:hypothetical protein
MIPLMLWESSGHLYNGCIVRLGVEHHALGGFVRAYQDLSAPVL